MTALDPTADTAATSPHVAFVPIVLQKSPRRGCRIEIRNNRIEANGFLNQRCISAHDLESILRARMRKIVLQHNLHLTDLPILHNHVRLAWQTGNHLNLLSIFR